MHISYIFKHNIRTDTYISNDVCGVRIDRNETNVQTMKLIFIISCCLRHSKYIEHGKTGNCLVNKDMLSLILMETVMCFYFQSTSMQWFMHRHCHVLHQIISINVNTSYVFNWRIQLPSRGIIFPVKSYLWTSIGWYREMKYQWWWSMSFWSFRQTMIMIFDELINDQMGKNGKKCKNGLIVLHILLLFVVRHTHTNKQIHSHW